MTQKPNKVAVLQQLQQEAAAISLLDLLAKLGPEFKERSLRRWLQQLVEEGSVSKIGQKRATKYLAAVKLTQSDRMEAFNCFSSASQQVVDKIKKPLFERKPTAYQENWLDSYRPNSDFYLPLKVRKELFQAGNRAGIHDPAGTYAHQIFHRLLIDLSYNSSRLEGNTYSLLDTERLLLRGDVAEGKLEEEKVMILNHKEAIRYLVDQALRLPITRNVICTLHYLLSDGLVESNEAGKVRRHAVRIGGSVYMPLEDPKRLDKQLVNIAEKAALVEDPFEQSLFLLVHISYLQAFADVNKRTARLSANIPLVKKNLVPLSFKDISVDDYMSCMIAVYELQDVRPLVDLYMHSYLRTCIAYDSTVKALGFDEIRVRYRQLRRALIRDVIVKLLVGRAMQDRIAAGAIDVPEKDREAFIEDVIEDLEQMDESRLAGMGVTPQELSKWAKKNI